MYEQLEKDKQEGKITRVWKVKKNTKEKWKKCKRKWKIIFLWKKREKQEN